MDQSRSSSNNRNLNYLNKFINSQEQRNFLQTEPVIIDTSSNLASITYRNPNPSLKERQREIKINNKIEYPKSQAAIGQIINGVRNLSNQDEDCMRSNSGRKLDIIKRVKQEKSTRRSKQKRISPDIQPLHTYENKPQFNKSSFKEKEEIGRKQMLNAFLFERFRRDKKKHWSTNYKEDTNENSLLEEYHNVDFSLLSDKFVRLHDEEQRIRAYIPHVILDINEFQRDLRNSSDNLYFIRNDYEGLLTKMKDRLDKMHSLNNEENKNIEDDWSDKELHEMKKALDNIS